MPSSFIWAALIIGAVLVLLGLPRQGIVQAAGFELNLEPSRQPMLIGFGALVLVASVFVQWALPSIVPPRPRGTVLSTYTVRSNWVGSFEWKASANQTAIFVGRQFDDGRNAECADPKDLCIVYWKTTKPQAIQWTTPATSENFAQIGPSTGSEAPPPAPSEISNNLLSSTPAARSISSICGTGCQQVRFVYVTDGQVVRETTQPASVVGGHVTLLSSSP